MNFTKLTLLLLALLSLTAYSADFEINAKRKANKIKRARAILPTDTVFVRDTIYIEKIVRSSVEVKVKDYKEETLAAFEEDAVALLGQWQNSIVDEGEKTEFVSSVSACPDSLYKKRLLAMSEQMVVEMPFNEIVKAHIQFYVEKQRRHSAAILGKLDYYMPIFEAELDRAGLPMELRCVPIIESALKPRAYSRAGAAGLWQFIYSTGKIYGLEVNSYLDERRDPLKSTQQAVRYFEDLYAIYKDWFLVIAAYNCGPGNVNKAIRRSGGKHDYWDIYYHLPRETRGYVPGFIAANYLLHYADKHEIAPIETKLPTFTDTVMINRPLHLSQVAEVMNLDIELLRELNPQYRLDLIPGGSQSYVLTLPGTRSADYVTQEDSIMAYRRNELIEKKRTNVKPAYTYSAQDMAPTGRTALTYKVKSGDNLGFIAEWYDVRVSDLRNWNNIRRNMIRVGQNLVVYVPKNKLSQYQNVNTQKRVSQASEGTEVTVDLNAEYEYYKVRNGDNLWLIARRYPGISAENIKSLNGMNNNKIKPGQYLRIKKKS